MTDDYIYTIAQYDVLRVRIEKDFETQTVADSIRGRYDSFISRRIQTFRDDMIKMLPRAPNNRASLEALRAMPTRRVILAFLTWRMRLIPAKPRAVRFWSGGITPAQAQAARPMLQPFLQKVATGKDLTPYLSDLVGKKGVILPGANPSDRRKDIDMVLTRRGLHHFHVGAVTPGNPKGRSGSLVFAEVLDNEFRLVALSDHPLLPERHHRIIRPVVAILGEGGLVNNNPLIAPTATGDRRFQRPEVKA